MNTSVISPGRAGLILLLTGQMLPMIDTSITNVALDAITHSLHATATELELIVALYGVAFAVCLALGSKLGDNFGRRRLFMWGVASFGLASLLCGMAGNIEQLLAARIVQGAGAALIMPQILATLHVTLKGTAHAKAISLFGGIGGIAFIVGQMGGGWLVSADIAGLGWRNAFYQRADLSGGAGAESSFRTRNPPRYAVTHRLAGHRAAGDRALLPAVPDGAWPPVALVVAAEGDAARHYSAGLADGAERAQKGA